MRNLYLSSAITFVRPASDFIAIVEYENPEIMLVKLLSTYLQQFDFAGQFPNFGNVNIGTVHPFAELSWQEVQGKTLNFSLFPSVTISDTNDNEDDMMLTRQIEQYGLTIDLWIKMKGAIASGQLLCSTANIARIDAAFAGSPVIAVTQHGYRAAHALDFVLWASDKIVTSVLYDAVKQFLTANVETFHNLGLDFTGNISGHRSGDFNVDFGKLLYGSTISIMVKINTSVMMLDVSRVGTINAFDTQTEPTYHVIGVPGES